MIEYLDKLDKQLFLFLNSLHSSFTDSFFGFMTDQETWYPLYALVLIFIFQKYRWQGLYLLAAILITIGLADQFSSGFCKPFFARLRPCHDPEISSLVHLTFRGCGGQFGFISGHSSNSFAIATIFFLLLRNDVKYIKLMYLWAAIVAYSRIAVGVHYPGDIFFGALAGSLIGWLVFQGFKRFKGELLIRLKESGEV
ncbi:phosphatase PAP2 family protein [Flexithrix dorotheae]|uniref:phosphatase PAP2 family protein n=1 Tax=Flexithrix dorotheae TaxID=70993 RepID=UPI0003A58F45|nr:phosphatase PAP2 family protein [Flexithrix dorotheae]